MDVSYPVVFHAPSVHFLGPLQKKGVKPVHCQNKIKHVKGVCCVNPCLFVPSVSNVPSVVSKQNVRGKTTKVLASLANHGYESSGSLYPQGGLQASLQAKTPLDKVSSDQKRLCQSQKKHGPKRSCSILWPSW